MNSLAQKRKIQIFDDVKAIMEFFHVKQNFRVIVDSCDNPISSEVSKVVQGRIQNFYQGVPKMKKYFVT